MHVGQRDEGCGEGKDTSTGPKGSNTAQKP